MKDQYVADINDYIKYSILRCIQQVCTDSMLICWMLTANDSGGDGRRISYLGDPAHYRHIDPELFDELKRIRELPEPSTHAIEAADVLPGARFFGRLLTDDASDRANYMAELWREANKSQVVFFDPDNGLDVPSTPLGRRGSRRYLYCHELDPLMEHQAAAIIYQHFPRVHRKTHVVRQLDRLSAALPGFTTFAAYSPSVAFLVAVPPGQRDQIENAVSMAAQRWNGQLNLAST